MPDVGGSLPEVVEADIKVGGDRARQDQALALGRNTRNYTTRLMPQLKSGIAAQGQFYSSGRRNAEHQAFEDYTDANLDVTNATQRILDDFDRRRLYASIGLIA